MFHLRDIHLQYCHNGHMQMRVIKTDNYANEDTGLPASTFYCYRERTGWLGWAMVLGSFQCRGVLLHLHIVGQGPAVLAAGAGRVGYIFFIFFIYLPFLMSCLLGDG